MRLLLACVTISLCVLAANAASTCYDDEKKCTREECCVHVQYKHEGKCQKRLNVDEVCEMKPLKNLFKEYVYKNKCPCAEGLKCVSIHERLLGKFAGKCQQ